MTRHLLSVADLDDRALRAVLDTTSEMHEVQRREVKKVPTLRGRTIINLFFEDSTRTRSSFEIAGKWMSADTINLTGKGSSASKGESLRDTARTIAAMSVDAIVLRHPASGAAHQVARWLDADDSGVSVLNAGDGTHEHPTQALLDAWTLEQRFGGPGSLRGRRVAIVGDVTHSRVFRSGLLCLTRLGAQVTVVAPPTLLPSGARDWAASAGFAISHDLDAVIAGDDLGTVIAGDDGATGPPDALMMLRVQRERMNGGYFPTPREYTIGYGLTRDRLAAYTAAAPHGVICHPGPMNRGLEIAADAADGASSLVLDQVSAGVAVRMAVLYHLLASDGGAA